MQRAPGPDDEKTVFEGRIFSVTVATLTLPRGERLAAELIRHPGSVVLVPVTSAGDVILVRQYRPAIRRWAWELPAGSLKRGEDIESAARRECHEEISLVPERLRPLGSFFPTPGYCDEVMHFFEATALREPAPDEIAHPDDDEDIEPRAFSRSALRSMIRSGEIVDLKTIGGLALLDAPDGQLTGPG
jgi:ADP-ribose pyrophosphatase